MHIKLDARAPLRAIVRPLAAAFVLAGGLFASQAEAVPLDPTTSPYGAPVTSGTPNDPFPQPLLGSPSLAKCETEGGKGSCGYGGGDWKDGLAAGDYSGAFKLTYNEYKENEAVGGTWTFDKNLVSETSEVLMPTLLVLKAERQYVAYNILGLLTGTWSTSWDLDKKGISHVSIYDGGGIAPVPVPAAGLLMLGAMGGLGFVARRRRKS